MSANTHPGCTRPDGHVCHRPSGKRCIEPDCDRPAGTLWGPHWCPECDAVRLDRISRRFDQIADEMEARR